MKSTALAVVLCAGASYAQQASTCTTSLVDPAPDGLVCEIRGHAVDLKRGVRQYPASSFSVCRDLCLNDFLCQSFNYQENTTRCRILVTQTKSEQIKPREGSKLTFSNSACYVRTGNCPNLNDDFSDLVTGGGLARPSAGTFGQQIAQLRPWSVYYRPSDTKSNVHIGIDEQGVPNARMTISGSEALGLYQRVLFEQDLGPDADSGMSFSFESFSGSPGDVYTITVTYHGTTVVSYQLQAEEGLFLLDGSNPTPYGQTVESIFSPELQDAITADPDRSQERAFGVLIQGPDGDVGEEGIFSIKNLVASKDSQAQQPSLKVL